MSDVAMPRLSDSMEEGTILKWLKSDGDEVKRGEELVEIETDKANMTYEADDDGTLAIVAQEGDTLAVGETIARIGGGGGDGAQASEAGAREEQTAQESQASGAAREPGRGAEDAAVSAGAEEASEREVEPVVTATAAGEGDGGGEGGRGDGDGQGRVEATVDGDGHGDGERVKASPVARRMAREMNVELSGVQGSGPGGRIIKADVEAAAKGGGAQAQAAPEAQAQAAPAAQAQAQAPEAAAAAPEAPAAPARDVAPPVVSGDAATGRGETTVEELSRLQQTIARRMAESKATAPEFVLNAEVDMEAAVELRKQLKVAADGGPAPSFNDFVIKACALALRDFPRANGAYRDGRFELYSRVNVGVAVAAQDALIVPTVFDADRKSLGQIARDARALAERVRAGQITPPELASGTFSVSNLGMYGISSFTAVINPPQAAILAVGAMEPRPVVVDGEVQVRNRMTITLSCDHRILYGADAAQFLARIRERLEQPLMLAL